MSKKCENCQTEKATTILNTVQLCETCSGIEKLAIIEVHSLIDDMLDRGISAKSILERFDLHNSLIS